MIEIAAAVVGLVGIGVALVAATYLLVSRRLPFALDATAAIAFLHERAIADADGFYTAMAEALDERRVENAHVIARLDAAFTVMLCGMLLGVCGLALAVAVA